MQVMKLLCLYGNAAFVFSFLHNGNNQKLHTLALLHAPSLVDRLLMSCCAAKARGRSELSISFHSGKVRECFSREAKVAFAFHFQTVCCCAATIAQLGELPTIDGDGFYRASKFAR